MAGFFILVGSLRRRKVTIWGEELYVNDFPKATSDPSNEDSDYDGYNDDVDQYPFDQPTINKTYIFCEGGADTDWFISWEGYVRKLAADLTFHNAEIIHVSTVPEFIDEWNNMGFNANGKGEYGISDVYTVFHGGPYSIQVGTGQYFTTTNLKNNALIDKRIGRLHLESCNNGNLDYLNDDKINGLGQNIAITFMKSCPHIEKVIAWDGYAHFAGPFEWSSGGDDVDTISIKKNGYIRYTQDKVTYTRTNKGIDYNKKFIRLIISDNNYGIIQFADVELEEIR